MKNLKHTAFMALLMGAIAGTAFAETITLRIGTSTNDGTVRAALFDSQKSFDDDLVVTGVNTAAVEGSTILVFDNLKPGTYGVALFHDRNGNEKLDRNLLGAPNEPFGFSNNPKIGFSAPKFEEFKFNYDGTPMELDITLNGG